MMSGVVEIAKNAGSTFGAAIRGGDLVCHGDVGGRTGICMKGGTIIVGGRTGAFSGFMMQRGRMIILGDAGANLGDSMYDGTIYVGGKIADLGVDAVEGEMTELDTRWLSAKLAQYNLKAPNGVEKLTKIVSENNCGIMTTWNRPRKIGVIVQEGRIMTKKKEASSGKAIEMNVGDDRNRLGNSFIFTPSVMNDIHIKASLGRYRMRGFSLLSQYRLGTN